MVMSLLEERLIVLKEPIYWHPIAPCVVNAFLKESILCDIVVIKVVHVKIESAKTQQNYNILNVLQA